MQFKSTLDDEPELNLIPLIDVLLMTLIFLIVTTSFSKEAQLHIRLPEAAAEAPADSSAVRIAIDAGGRYYIEGRQLLNSAPETVRAAIARAVGRRQDPLIVVQADGQAPHAAVVRVMDATRRLGFTRLTFATQAPPAAAAAP